MSANLDLVRSIYADWARCQVKAVRMPSSPSAGINEACAVAERLGEERR